MKTTIVKKENFTTVHNNLILDESISWKAKGILLYMLSRPDDWKFNIKEISKNAKDGTDSVKYGLQELVKAGYISRKRNSDGTLDYYIFEDKEKNNIVDYMSKATEKPQVEKPQVEKPQVEKPLHNKERILLKKEYSNNNINKNIYSAVTDYLNEKTGRAGSEKYSPSSKETIKYIKARQNDGYKLEDFKTVIDNMVTAWTGTEWETYLRPRTLFSNKFEDYLRWKNNKNITKKTANDNDFIVTEESLAETFGRYK